MLFSTFLQLAVGLRDLHQAEKESTFFKMTAKNGPGWRQLSFWVKIVVILWIFSDLQSVISISAWDKSRDLAANWRKLEDI